MADFELAEGDTTPALTATLNADLTGATVKLVLKNADATSEYLNKTATISSAADGKVSYTWAAADTSVPGDYVGEWQVTFSDSTVKFYPTEGYFTVSITPKLTGSTKPDPTYVTTRDVLARTRSRLSNRVKPQRNKLNSAIGPTDETIVFTYDRGLADSVALSIGLETLYVWQIAGRNLTVERGFDNTIPAQHAAGDIVLIDPEFTDAQILQAVNEVLTALPSAGVYQVKTIDLDATATEGGYDLADDVIDVLDVLWQDTDDTTTWTQAEMWEVQRNMPTDVFPSGVALFLPHRPFPWPAPTATGTTATITVRVKYRAAFTALSSLFDDVVTVTGLPVSALDLLPLGAAIKLMSGAPIQRVFNLAQPDPRDSAETRVSDVLNAPAALRQEFTNRVQQEADILSREQKYRRPTRTLMGGLRPVRRWW